MRVFVRYYFHLHSWFAVYVYNECIQDIWIQVCS